MKVLIDTCVISELQKPKPASGVKAFFRDIDSHQLFLSVLSLGEISKGICLLSPGKRRDDLNQWLSGLETLYAERILVVDHETTRIWGELSARALSEGRTIGAVDGLIAATALRHGLHLVTRNVKDFEASGVLLINPW